MGRSSGRRNEQPEQGSRAPETNRRPKTHGDILAGGPTDTEREMDGGRILLLGLREK